MPYIMFAQRYASFLRAAVQHRCHIVQGFWAPPKTGQTTVRRRHCNTAPALGSVRRAGPPIPVEVGQRRAYQAREEERHGPEHAQSELKRLHEIVADAQHLCVVAAMQPSARALTAP